VIHDNTRELAVDPEVLIQELNTKKPLSPKHSQQLAVILQVVNNLFTLLQQKLQFIQKKLKAVGTMAHAMLLAEQVYLAKKIIVDGKQISRSKITTVLLQQPDQLPFDISPPPLTPDEERKLLLTKKIINGSIILVINQLPPLSVKLSTVDNVEDVIRIGGLILQLSKALVRT